MDRETLSTVPLKELLHLADKHGVEMGDDSEREALEELVFEAIEEHRQEHRQTNNNQVRIEETKYETRPDEPPAELVEVDAIELPETYNETRVVLILRDPEWAFAYWDLKQDERDEFEKNDDFEGLVLRIYSAGTIDDLDSRTSERFDIPVTLLDNRWYINLPEQQIHIRIALVVIVGGTERILALSNPVWSPKGALADDTNGAACTTDEILAQTGIQNLDVPASGKEVPQRILELVDDGLSFT